MISLNSREVTSRGEKSPTGELRSAGLFAQVLGSAGPSGDPRSHMGSEISFESSKSIYPRIHNILLYNPGCRNSINPFLEKPSDIAVNPV